MPKPLLVSFVSLFITGMSVIYLYQLTGDWFFHVIFLQILNFILKFLFAAYGRL